MEVAFVHHLHEHDQKLVNNLHDQWKEQKYCDLVIIAEGGSLSVHACVISSFSPKIASMISKQSTQFRSGGSHMYTVEVNFNYDVIVSIVTTFYTGIFQSPAKLLIEALLAAQWLGTVELIDALKKHKDMSVKPKNKHLFVKNCSIKNLNTAFLDMFKSTKSNKTSIVSDVKNEVENCNSPSPKLDVNLHIVNLNSSSKKGQNIRNSIKIKIPLAEPVNDKMSDSSDICDSSDVMSVKSSNNCHINASELLKTKTKDDEIKNSDTYTKISEKLINTSPVRSSRLKKKDNLQIFEHGQFKKKKEIFRTKARKRKSPKKNSSKEKIRESETCLRSKTSQQQSDHKSVAIDVVKTEGGNMVNNESPRIEEIPSEDPGMDNFIVGNDNFMKCRKCYLKFTSLELYHSHLKNHPTFECGQCHQVFASKFSLGKHVRTVHAGLKHLICRHCDFEGKSQVDLRKHSMDVHNDRRPFACSYNGCKFTAVKHCQVIKHMIIHSEEKGFTCSKCDMSFSRQIGLASHQKACYKLQEFLCDLCGQSFNHKHSMRKHRRVIHFGEKPYKCAVCSNSFGDHRNLHRHMRIHENSFPYSCPVCKQQFRHSNSLKSHVAAKHKDHSEIILLNLDKRMYSNLGGVNYKRILRDDLINTMTSKVGKSGDWNQKDSSCKVKQEVLSPTEMFESATFPGEFLIAPEDSNFDTSNSNDLEFVMHHVDSNTPYNLDLNGESGSVTDEGSGDISNLSYHPTSNSSLQIPQVAPADPVIYKEKDKSTLYVTVALSGQLPLGQLYRQTQLSTDKRKVVSLIKNFQASSSATLTLPDSSEHPLSQPNTLKLQQSSQKALEKFLSNNRNISTSQQVVTLSNSFRDVTITKNTNSSSLPASSHFQTLDPVSDQHHQTLNYLVKASSPLKTTNLAAGTDIKPGCLNVSETSNQFLTDFKHEVISHY